MPTSAGIYARISQDSDGLKAGVKRQEADCRALAKRRGWPIGEIYIDNDLSAWTGRARPAYRRMLADIEAGLIDGVIVWDLDRLHRRPAELEEFFGICDRAGLRAMASVSGDVDLSTDDGRFHARILGAVAKKSSDDTSRRLKRKLEELAREGKPTGSKRPFGYDPGGLVVRKSEAKLIREAAERVLSGEGLRGVCEDWNRRGVSTATGKGRWQNAILKRILLSPRVSGQSVYRGEVVGKGQWPAILDRDTQERLAAVLKDKSRGKLVVARSYLLPGFAYCGRCGARLVSRPTGNKRRAYRCSRTFGGCDGIVIVADPLEDLVRDAVFIALDTPELRDAVRAAEGEDIVQAELLESLRQDEGTLEQLARDHYADALITRAEYLFARVAIEERIKTSRQHLEARSRDSVLTRLPEGADGLREAWETRGLDWRRSLIGTVIEKVIVKPSSAGANRFDPERVEVVWRV
jgi:site-specific DNA recombinase